MGSSSLSTPKPRPGGVNRHSRVPLWRQLRDELRTRLEAGEFGEVFPGEHALATEYGVSRNTVREALRELRQSGEVTAARGYQPRPGGEAYIDQPLGALYSLFDAVEATGLEQRSIVRGLDIRADAQVAERLGLEASVPLLYLERLRLAGGEALAHDRVWLPAERTRPLLEADFSRTALYDELARRCGMRLTGGEERIQAVVPTAADRRLLQMSSDTAAFAIDRIGRVLDEPIEWRRTLIRGDRFAAVARFSARAGYRIGIGANTF